jgi:hypothetical protein
VSVIKSENGLIQFVSPQTHVGAYPVTQLHTHSQPQYQDPKEPTNFFHWFLFIMFIAGLGVLAIVGIKYRAKIGQAIKKCK